MIKCTLLGNMFFYELPKHEEKWISLDKRKLIELF